MFDEQPDGDLHGECAAEIARLNAELEKCAAALPGPLYMDPPDGGDVSVSEQLRRMAKDAARYRWLRAENSGPIGIVRYALDADDEEHMSMAGADEAIDVAMVVTPNV